MGLAVREAAARVKVGKTTLYEALGASATGTATVHDFYELLSCGASCRRMGWGGRPAMMSRHQWMASLWASRRIFLSSQPAPMARHYG